jgi:hypothetical protein
MRTLRRVIELRRKRMPLKDIIVRKADGLL